MAEHRLHVSNGDYEVTLTLRDPREGDAHWNVLAASVMQAITTGDIVVHDPEQSDIWPSKWKALRFLPERHGEVTVPRGDNVAGCLSALFGGISVRPGDKLTWGLGTEGQT